MGQLQVLKEDIAQLLGAVDVEDAHAAGVIDGLLQALNLLSIPHAELFEEIPVHAETDILHAEEHKRQRKLDFLHEPHHALLLHHLFLPYGQGEKACGIPRHFPADIPEGIALFLGIEQVSAQHDVPVKGCRDRLIPLAQQMQQTFAVMDHGGVCAEFFRENAQHLVRIQPGMQQIPHQLHAGRPQVTACQGDFRIRHIHRQRPAAFTRSAQERTERVDAFDFLCRLEVQELQFRRRFLCRLFLGSGGLHHVLHRVRCTLPGNPADQLVELQFFECRDALHEVRHGTVREPELHRRVPVDRGQRLAFSGKVGIVADFFSELALDFTGMAQHILEAPVLLEQFHGRLVAHARNARNVVRAVAGQSLPVRHLVRPEAVLFIDHPRREPDGLRNAFSRKQEFRASADQLQCVPVSREQQRGNAGLHAQA